MGSLIVEFKKYISKNFFIEIICMFVDYKLDSV